MRGYIFNRLLRDITITRKKNKTLAQDKNIGMTHDLIQREKETSYNEGPLKKKKRRNNLPKETNSTPSIQYEKK